MSPPENPAASWPPRICGQGPSRRFFSTTHVIQRPLAIIDAYEATLDPAILPPRKKTRASPSHATVTPEGGGFFEPSFMDGRSLMAASTSSRPNPSPDSPTPQRQFPWPPFIALIACTVHGDDRYRGPSPKKTLEGLRRNIGPTVRASRRHITDG